MSKTSAPAKAAESAPPAEPDANVLTILKEMREEFDAKLDEKSDEIKSLRADMPGKERDAGAVIQNQRRFIPRVNEEAYLDDLAVRPIAEIVCVNTHSYNPVSLFNEVRDPAEWKRLLHKAFIPRFSDWGGPGSNLYQPDGHPYLGWPGLKVIRLDRIQRVKVTAEDIDRFALPTVINELANIMPARVQDGEFSLEEVLRVMTERMRKNSKLWTGERFRQDVAPRIRNRWAEMDAIQNTRDLAQSRSEVDLLKGPPSLVPAPAG